jgi:pyruvate-formate lyase
MFSVIGLFAFDGVINYLGYLGILPIIFIGMAFFFYDECKEDSSGIGMSGTNATIGFVIAFILICFIQEKPTYINQERDTEIYKICSDYIESVNTYVEENEEEIKTNIPKHLVEDLSLNTTMDFYDLSTQCEDELNEILQPYIE